MLEQFDTATLDLVRLTEVERLIDLVHTKAGDIDPVIARDVQHRRGVGRSIDGHQHQHVGQAGFLLEALVARADQQEDLDIVRHIHRVDGWGDGVVEAGLRRRAGDAEQETKYTKNEAVHG
ncbi:MAG: hypothetical protein HND48_25110 [Chloroflexi bacterium]|nr:hypothetical protein [Chloroflexota bacterium]